MIHAYQLVVLVPYAAALVLVAISGYRLGAVVNVLVSAATLAAGLWLMVGERTVGEYAIVDELNVVFIVINTLVGFTTALFSASYIGHEIETGRLSPGFVRFYHAMFQAMMGSMNVALIANNIGVMWVGLELATLITVVMVGLYRTPQAIEAAWKYFILAGVGISLAFFGTILIYLAGQPALGEGVPAMTWIRRSSISPSSSCWSATAPRSGWRRCMPGCRTRMPRGRRRSPPSCRACC